MLTYLAGTGESDDFGTFILSIIIALALLTLITWGVPWFRNRLRLRKEARLHAEEELRARENPDASGPEEDGAHWQSTPVR